MRCQKAQMEIRRVAYLVSQGELSILTGRKTFLGKSVQPETQMSTDIQVCKLIPTSPDHLVFCLVGFVFPAKLPFQEITIQISFSHMAWQLRLH